MTTPKFVSGPPGTGKTHKFLIKKYKELLKTYSPEKIIMLSHTNVAADELKDAVLKLPEMLERGLRKKFFKYKICTIHAFCKSKVLKKELRIYVERTVALKYREHLNQTLIMININFLDFLTMHLDKEKQ